MLTLTMDSLETEDEFVQNSILDILSTGDSDREKIYAASELTSNRTVLDELRVYLEKEDSYCEKRKEDDNNHEDIINHRLYSPILDEYSVLDLVEEEEREDVKCAIEVNDVEVLETFVSNEVAFKQCKRFIECKQIEEELLEEIPAEDQNSVAAILRDNDLHANDKIRLFKHALPNLELRKMANTARKTIDNVEDELKNAAERIIKHQMLVDSMNNLPDVSTFLLLGSSGAGKSTLINGVANHLMHKTMEDAKTNLQVLISVYFVQNVVGNEETKEIPISIPVQGSNEVMQTGAAGTSDVRIYEFEWSVAGRKKKIRIIDTPGIADPKGINEDLKNLGKILKALTGIYEIHGICFLLNKATRFTIGLKYVITELFSRLPKSAAENILFCFTKTRDNQFKPGEVLPILQKFIQTEEIPISVNKSNIFCFDNDSFKFLCAWQKVAFDHERVQIFSSTWHQTTIHYYNLLSTAKCLVPYKTELALTLENVHVFLDQVCATILDILDKTKTTRDNIDTYQCHIKLIDQQIEEVHKKATKTVCERIPIDKTHTVCKSTNCIKALASGAMWFKQLCHENCNCQFPSEIKKEQMGIANLQNCSCFETIVGVVNDSSNKNSDTTLKREEIFCKLCKCSYSCHMQISYEYKESEKTELLRSDEEEISDCERRKTAAAGFIQTQKQEINLFETELVYLNEIATKLANYIVKNAIVPFNKSIIEYLKIEIKNAEMANTDRFNFSNAAIEQLKRKLAIRSQMKDIIQRATGVAMSREEITTFMMDLKRSSQSSELSTHLKRTILLEKGNAHVEVITTDLSQGWLKDA